VPGEVATAESENPAARPVTLRDRLASLIEVVICSGMPTQLLVTVALAAAGVAALSAEGDLSLRYIVWLSLVDTLIVIGLVWLFLRARRDPPAQLFLGARPARREALLGLLLLPATFILLVGAAGVIEQVAPWLKDPDGNPLARLLRDPGDIALFALVAVLAGGIREELQRAFILHRFEQHLGGGVVGLVLFSAAFGAGHALQGWDAAILTGILGAFWGIVYLWRRSVVAPVVCHAAFNLIEVLYHGLQA
jgi:membrane protease YdiL (CAAX protease family)